MSLRARIFISFALFTGSLVVLSIVLVNNRFHKYTLQEVRSDVETIYKRFDAFYSARMNSFITEAINVSNDHRIRGSLSTGDPETINLAAREINDLYHFDLFWVLDTDGRRIVTASDEIPESIDLSGRTVIRDVLNGHDSGDTWLLDGKLYQVAAVTVFSGTITQGILLIGREFDEWISRSFTDLSGYDVVFLDGSRVISASTDSIEPEKMDKALLELRTEVTDQNRSKPVVPISLGMGLNAQPPFVGFRMNSEPLVSSLFSLKGAGGEVLADCIVLRSMQQEFSLLRRIRQALIILGAFAILFSLLVAYLISKQLARPVSQLVQSSERLGAGDLDHPIDSTSRGEIGTLASAMNTMRISLKGAREELIRSERLSTIGRMASGIIQDFKQPITALYGYVELLTLPGMDTTQREDYKVNIFKQVDRMLGMVNELLDFARGDQKLHPEPTDLSSFIRNIVDDFEPDFIDREIKMDLNIEWEGTLAIDAMRLRRGIENILRNAVQALEKGGRITITVTPSNGIVRLTIADDGPGIPPKIRDKLFNPFVTHGKRDGTGLGLAVTQKVVRDHYGEIEVDSEPGSGTTFTITLPRGDDANEADPGV